MSEKVSEQFFNQLIKKNLNIYSDKVYQGLHLDSIFLYSLFSTNFMSVRLRRNMLQILVDYFNQRSHLLSELIEIEIIDTDEELKIYHELDGITPISEQLVSIKRLDFLIEKLLRNYELIEFLNKNKNQSQAKADNYYRGKQEKTIEIIAILEILNAKLKERKSNPYLFLKTQNILRNLQYHEVFMKILKNLHPREPAEFLLMQRIIVFLRYFTFLNGINQQQILSNSNIFFELMNDKLCIKRLISSTLEITKGNNAIFEHINNYFDLLENLESFKKEVHPFVILQILSILQSLVCTQEKTFLPRIQKKILSRLLKNKKLLKFTMKKSYLDYKNSLMLKLQKVQNNEKYMEKLMIHLNVIHLFGNLCRDFRMGTLQMQKVLVYEQMKNLLFDANTPFIFKKVFLFNYFWIETKIMLSFIIFKKALKLFFLRSILKLYSKYISFNFRK